MEKKESTKLDWQQIANRQFYEGKIPPEYAETIAKMWSNGSPKLEELIQYCILHDVRISSVCNGKEKGDAYVMLPQMPKEMYKFILEHMKENFPDNYTLGLIQFGKRQPSLRIGRDETENEGFFDAILQGIRIYTEDKEKPQNYDISPKINSAVEYIFSPKGRNTILDCKEDGEEIRKVHVPLFDTYIKDPIRAFCKRSKKTLGEILNVSNVINMAKRILGKDDKEDVEK